MRVCVCVCVYVCVCVCVMTTSVVKGAEGCGGVGTDTKETDWSERLHVIEACT